MKKTKLFIALLTGTVALGSLLGSWPQADLTGQLEANLLQDSNEKVAIDDSVNTNEGVKTNVFQEDQGFFTATLSTPEEVAVGEKFNVTVNMTRNGNITNRAVGASSTLFHWVNPSARWTLAGDIHATAPVSPKWVPNSPRSHLKNSDTYTKTVEMTCDFPGYSTIDWTTTVNYKRLSNMVNNYRGLFGGSNARATELSSVYKNASELVAGATGGKNISLGLKAEGVVRCVAPETPETETSTGVTTTEATPVESTDPTPASVTLTPSLTEAFILRILEVNESAIAANCDPCVEAVEKVAEEVAQILEDVSIEMLEQDLAELEEEILAEIQQDLNKEIDEKIAMRERNFERRLALAEREAEERLGGEGSEGGEGGEGGEGSKPATPAPVEFNASINTTRAFGSNVALEDITKEMVDNATNGGRRKVTIDVTIIIPEGRPGEALCIRKTSNGKLIYNHVLNDEDENYDFNTVDTGFDREYEQIPVSSGAEYKFTVEIDPDKFDPSVPYFEVIDKNTLLPETVTMLAGEEEEKNYIQEFFGESFSDPNEEKNYIKEFFGDSYSELKGTKVSFQVFLDEFQISGGDSYTYTIRPQISGYNGSSVEERVPSDITDSTFIGLQPFDASSTNTYTRPILDENEKVILGIFRDDKPGFSEYAVEIQVRIVKAYNERLSVERSTDAAYDYAELVILGSEKTDTYLETEREFALPEGGLLIEDGESKVFRIPANSIPTTATIKTFTNEEQESKKNKIVSEILVNFQNNIPGFNLFNDDLQFQFVNFFHAQSIHNPHISESDALEKTFEKYGKAGASSASEVSTGTKDEVAPPKEISIDELLKITVNPGSAYVGEWITATATVTKPSGSGKFWTVGTPVFDKSRDDETLNPHTPIRPLQKKESEASSTEIHGKYYCREAGETTVTFTADLFYLIGDSDETGQEKVSGEFKILCKEKGAKKSDSYVSTGKTRGPVDDETLAQFFGPLFTTPIGQKGRIAILKAFQEDEAPVSSDEIEEVLAIGEYITGLEDTVPVKADTMIGSIFDELGSYYGFDEEDINKDKGIFLGELAFGNNIDYSSIGEFMSGYTLVETGPATGIYKGDFIIPDVIPAFGSSPLYGGSDTYIQYGEGSERNDNEIVTDSGLVFYKDDLNKLYLEAAYLIPQSVYNDAQLALDLGTACRNASSLRVCEWCDPAKEGGNPTPGSCEPMSSEEQAEYCNKKYPEVDSAVDDIQPFLNIQYKF